MNEQFVTTFSLFGGSTCTFANLLVTVDAVRPFPPILSAGPKCRPGQSARGEEEWRHRAHFEGPCFHVICFWDCGDGGLNTCKYIKNFIHSGPTSTENPSKTNPEPNQNQPTTDPKGIQNLPKTKPRPTQHHPKTDPKPTEYFAIVL